MKRVILAVGWAALAVGTANPQVLHTLESPNPEDHGCFGWSVSGVGDVNGDGYGDIVVGAPFEDGGGLVNSGRAYVFSGDGSGILHTLTSPLAQGAPPLGSCFGFAVSGVGDVNNDGYDDIVVGAYQEDVVVSGAGRAYVFNGSTGDTLYSLVSPSPVQGAFGYVVSGAGDVNEDGHPDVVVAAPNESAAYVFSGDGGSLLLVLDPGILTWILAVSGVGDVDADGCCDVIAGAPYETPEGIAYVFSGNSGELIYTLDSPNPIPSGLFGCSAAGVGDVDGDSRSDIVVGASQEDGGCPDAGRAYVFSGAGGEHLYTLESPTPLANGLFGCSVASAGDVDCDGFDDVIVGARTEASGPDRGGQAYVFSGNGGGLLSGLTSPSPEHMGRFGCAVSGAIDANGDGYADVVVGAEYEDGGGWNAGRAYVFNGIEVPVELASFTGEHCEAGVRLVWLTLTERDNLGFNVDRATAQSGPYVRLNERIIPGAGTSMVPHSYEYLDRAVHPGAVYWYRLEDVSLDGVKTRHGPIHVAVPHRPELGLQVLGSSDPTFVLTFARAGQASLKLYDVRGKLAATLWEGEAPESGSTTVRPELRRALPTGQYTASLSQAGRTVRSPVVIVR
jgi:hypothetical protein